MKIVQINVSSNGSTGSIMMNIHKKLLSYHNNLFESYAFFGRGKENNDALKITSKRDVYFHVIMSRLTGKTGFYSKKATKKLISKLKEIKPDIIHLHNIHGYYINIELLFDYIKKNKIKTVWTLHDCWAFTGHCSHFLLKNCYKWQYECNNCPNYMNYPKSFIDTSNWCFKRKKEIFTGVDDLTIVTPSLWLANLVKQSFLKDYSVRVINNGIDINIFKPLNKDRLLFRKKYHLDNKHIILGVASFFTNSKGYNDYIKLSSIIDNSYIIVLVGLTKKQINNLPNNILGIEKTNNVEELVDIYNSADVFVNLTYQDTYPTVNLEAIACGIPVLTYDTGGSPEFTNYVKNLNSINYIIEKKKVEEDFTILKKSIENIVNSKKSFEIKNRDLLSKSKMINDYINIYMNK